MSTPLKLYYTVPCELVFSWSPETHDTTDQAVYKNVQLYLIESQFTPQRLQFCVLHEEKDKLTIFSVEMDLRAVPSMHELGDAMLCMRFGGSGLLLSFAFKEIREEFVGFVEAWVASPVAAQPELLPAAADGPKLAGTDAMTFLHFLRRCALAFEKTRQELGAELVSGMSEDIRMNQNHNGDGNVGADGDGDGDMEAEAEGDGDGNGDMEAEGDGDGDTEAKGDGNSEGHGDSA
ncbi:hypothetical protein C8Q76DRAFT_792822 [Earliella scabrosa]|nr:hypothetical protein C8Q76DRAFT_792822 [Earliella scabrosa]